MAEGLITDIVSPEAIKQLDELDAKLKAVDKTLYQYIIDLNNAVKSTDQAKTFKDLNNAMSEQRGIMNEMNKARQESIKINQQISQSEKKVIYGLKELADLSKEAKERINDYSDSIYRNVEANNKLKEDLKKIQDDIKELNNNRKEGKILSDQYTESLTRLRVEEANVKTEISASNQIIKAQSKEMAASEGSMNQIAQQLALLKKAYRDLSASARNTVSGEELLSTIKKLDPAIKGFDESLGDFQRNVGNYESGAKTLRGEIRALVEEMSELKLAGKDNSERYQELSVKTAEYQKVIANTQKEVATLSSNTAKLDGTLQALQSLQAAFIGIQSIEGFAEKGSALASVMDKLKIAIAGVSAAVVIQNTIQRQSPVMKGIFTIQATAAAKATALQAKNTVAATIAQRAFNVVANANPYVLLATGIGLLVGALAIYSSKTKDVISSQKNLLDINEKSIDGYVREKTEIQSIISLVKNENTTNKEKEEILKNVNEKYLDSNHQLKNLNDLERWSIDQAPELIKAFEYKAKAIAAFELAVEANKEAIKNEQKNELEFLSFTEKLTLKLSNVFKSILPSAKQSYELLDKNSKEYKDEAIKTEDEKSKSFLKIKEDYDKKYIDKAKEIGLKLDDENKKSLKSQKAQLDTIKKYQDLEIQAIEDEEERKIKARDLAYDRDLADLQKSFKDKNNLTEKEQQSLLDLETIYLRERNEIEDDYNNKRLKSMEDSEKEKESRIKKWAEDIVNISKKQFEEEESERVKAYLKEEDDLADQYSKGLINKAEFEKKKSDLSWKYQKESIENEISALKELLSNENVVGEARVKIEKNLSDAEIELSKITTDKKIKDIEDETEARKKAAEKAKELAKEALNMYFDFINQRQEARIAEIDAELEKIQERKDRELEMLDESVMSEETRAAETKRINEQAEKDKKALEEKRKQEEAKAFEAQKLQSIAQVAISTAEAIMKITSQTGIFAPPLIVGTAALGAAQIAIIASQKMPSYWAGAGVNGRPEHKGGLAIVGDTQSGIGGKTEYIQTPRGEIFQTPAMPTLVDLEAGSKVFPSYHDLLRNIHPEIPKYESNNTNNECLVNELKDLKKVVRLNKANLSVNLDHKGIWVISKNESQRERYINRMVRR